MVDRVRALIKKPGDPSSKKRELLEIEKQARVEFEQRAEKLAIQFTIGANKHSKAQWKKTAEKIGIPVVTRPLSPRMERALKAIIDENVALIKSIPERYFARLSKILYEGAVRGYDSNKIYRELLRAGVVTKRHAKLIARDQNNKASSSISMMRDMDAGITQGQWLHSNHWKTAPRKSHLRAGREQLIFNIAEGAMLEDENGVVRATWPGQEINCRCTYMPVIDYGTVGG